LHSKKQAQLSRDHISELLTEIIDDLASVLLLQKVEKQQGNFKRKTEML
jgi:hypothetical protein